MLDLTFGEQVKIILSRKGMTIKELAEIIEERTGKKMSRQNLTQRLGRDNFQEQDMRMIAEILECPFRLSILADSEAVERASNIGDVAPTERELSRLAKAKARKVKKVKEAERLADAMEQIPSEMESEVPEKEMTLEDYITIHEELERQETDKLPKIEKEPSITEYIRNISEAEEAEEAHPASEVEDVLRELEEMEKQEKEDERKRRETVKVQEETRQEPKRVTGWRAVFQRRPRKERIEEAREEEQIEQEIQAEPVMADDDYIDYEEREENLLAEQEEILTEQEVPEEEQMIEETTEDIIEEDDEAEDLTRGEVNPYTGHEYESNSVRMHPKRIGYVQVYDRKDHAWTDMTEWAFLGYQERKKALLGRDYEPPIYLD